MLLNAKIFAIVLVCYLLSVSYMLFAIFPVQQFTNKGQFERDLLVINSIHAAKVQKNLHMSKFYTTFVA